MLGVAAPVEDSARKMLAITIFGGVPCEVCGAIIKGIRNTYVLNIDGISIEVCKCCHKDLRR
jgi:hypothetical protein